MLYRLKQLTMLVGDIAALYLGLFLAVFERNYGWTKTADLQDLVYPMTILFFGVAVPVMFIFGLYDTARAKNSREFFLKIVASAGIWIFMGISYFYLINSHAVNPKTILALTALNSFGAIAAWRYVHNRFLTTTIWTNRIIFVGFTAEVAEIMAVARLEPQRGYEILGIVTPAPETLPPEMDIPHDNSLSGLMLKIGSAARPDMIVLSSPAQKDANLTNELYKLIFSQIGIVNLAKFYEEFFARIPPFTFSESWFLNNLDEQRAKIYDRWRILVDYLCALLLGVFFAVSFPLIAILIKLNSPGPVFFRQERVGRLGKKFTVYKYRTMKALVADGSAELTGPQFAAEKDERVTVVGRLLRSSRLDEVPQFINILKGQMAIIGPRPERPEFVEKLTEKMPFYSLRLLVKPGLTGWAQVQNAYYGTMEENLRKLEYDLYYIKNRGLLLDTAIILRTINTVIRMIGR